MLDRSLVPQFEQAVLAAKTVFITAHVGPDGDTLGSMLGLKHMFEAHYPHLSTIHGVISGKLPDIYRFMPGIEDIRDVETASDILDQYDLAFSVDCGALERLGPAGAYFKSATQSINIDHHYSNSLFGRINIMDFDAAASGEVVADIFAELGKPLTEKAATALYVALMTDTGGFKYSNTNAKVFDLASKLCSAGANPELCYRYIYETRPLAQSLLHAKALTEARFNDDATLSWTVVTQAMMREFGAREEHVDGLVEELRRVDSVLIAAMFRENTHGITKVSLRSDTQDINVADILKTWGGGGHKMAAGASIERPPSEVAPEVLKALEQAIRQIKPLPAASK